MIPVNNTNPPSQTPYYYDKIPSGTQLYSQILKIKRLALYTLATTLLAGTLALYPVAGFPYTVALVGGFALFLAIKTVLVVRNLFCLVELPEGEKRFDAEISWNDQTFFWGSRTTTLADDDGSEKLEIFNRRVEELLSEITQSHGNKEELVEKRKQLYILISSYPEWNSESKYLSGIRLNGQPLVLQRDDIMVPVFFENCMGNLPHIPYLPFRLFFENGDFSKPLKQNQKIEFTHLNQDSGKTIAVSLVLKDNISRFIQDIEDNAYRVGTQQTVPNALKSNRFEMQKFEEFSKVGLYPPVQLMKIMRGDFLPQISSAQSGTDPNFWGFSFVWPHSELNLIELTFDVTEGGTRCKIDAKRTLDRANALCWLKNIPTPLDSELGRKIHPDQFCAEIVLPGNVLAQPTISYEESLVKVCFPYNKEEIIPEVVV